MRGRIKFFNKIKGFGFIIGDDDKKDYFFHKSAITNFDKLKKDDPVLFDAEQTDRGEKAINVQLARGDE